LKKSQVDGVKFRRQQSIGHYIVDFYSYEYRLAIELDGEIHDDQEMIKHDSNRDAFLKQNEINVLRFKNEEVFEDIGSVLNKIREQFTTPDPS
jgi:very-short-patch-repair endonuclease